MEHLLIRSAQVSSLSVWVSLSETPPVDDSGTAEKSFVLLETVFVEILFMTTFSLGLWKTRQELFLLLWCSFHQLNLFFPVFAENKKNMMETFFSSHLRGKNSDNEDLQVLSNYFFFTFFSTIESKNIMYHKTRNRGHTGEWDCLFRGIKTCIESTTTAVSGDALGFFNFSPHLRCVSVIAYAHVSKAVAIPHLQQLSLNEDSLNPCRSVMRVHR